MFLKGKAHRGLFERLGIDFKIFTSRPIWIHAVSVGEVRLAAILTFALKHITNREIIVSCVTLTGNNLAHKLLKDQAEIIYAPLDISFITNRFLDKINPYLFIIMETELWPNLVYSLAKRHIPIVLLNGRISPGSFKGYSKVKLLTRAMLAKIGLFCMQTEDDKKKIVALGADASKVKVSGSMKFDADDYKDNTVDTLDYSLEKNEQLFIAASTHHDEEKTILIAYKNLIKDFPNLRLLIAPRHIQRVGEIEKLIKRFGFRSLKFSERKDVLEPGTVVVLDTIGQLRGLYRFASIVFIGGSLVKKGGQNILEPASFAKPVMFGPHMFNFAHIVSIYLSNQAAITVKDGIELERSARNILSNPSEKEKLGIRAKQIIFENKGATNRNIALIEGLVKLK